MFIDAHLGFRGPGGRRLRRAILASRLVQLWLLLAACWLSACAGPLKPSAKSQATALETIALYRAALLANDPASAYRLLAPVMKQRLSYEQFSAKWRETEFERAAQLKQLSHIKVSDHGGSGSARSQALASGPVTEQAFVTVTMPQGTTLVLGLAAPVARWQVHNPDLAAVYTATPEQVLRLLVDAVEQRNYFALLRLLSSAERTALEAELRERVERLRTSLSRRPPLSIEVRGDRAHYQYDPRFFIDLVREKDGWRLLDAN